MGAGKVGWDWGNGLRTEVEGACDYNGINERNGTPGPERSTGDQGTQGVFGNVFYDLSPPKVGIPVRGIEPYAGLGAGVLWTHSSPITSVAEDGNVFRLGGTGENFAYQAVIGVGIPPGMPGPELGIDWRFIGIDVRSGAVGTSYSPAGVRGNGAPVAGLPASVGVRDQLRLRTLFFGTAARSRGCRRTWHSSTGTGGS